MQLTLIVPEVHLDHYHHIKMSLSLSQFFMWSSHESSLMTLLFLTILTQQQHFLLVLHIFISTVLFMRINQNNFAININIQHSYNCTDSMTSLTNDARNMKSPKWSCTIWHLRTFKYLLEFPGLTRGLTNWGITRSSAMAETPRNLLRFRLTSSFIPKITKLSHPMGYHGQYKLFILRF